MESRPDSARAVLESLDATAMSGKNRAKHALLLSMALDKTYEDREDFKILQPAIDYYEKHGSATDKLRTFYYQGRIFENKGELSPAMKCFNRALDKGRKSEDVLTKARLQVAQSNIYLDRFDFDKACEASMQAAECFHNHGRISSYVNCMLKTARGHRLACRYEDASACLDACEQYLPDVPIGFCSEYYASRLLCLINVGKENELEKALREYEAAVPESERDYNTIAMALQQLGRRNDALKALEKVSLDDEDEVMRRHAVAVGIHEELGQYKEALENYVEFNDMYDNYRSDVSLEDIEENHKLERLLEKADEAGSAVLTVIVFLAVGVTFACIRVRHNLKAAGIKRKEAELDAVHYKELLTKKDEAANILRKREDVLSKMFAASISGNKSSQNKADSEFNKLLEDKNGFMATTKSAFAVSYPRFIAYLESRKLTEKEIELCCLYALGLNGKEISTYLDNAGHYNDSSAIRHKLELPSNGVNLGTYIRELLKPQEEDSAKE